MVGRFWRREIGWEAYQARCPELIPPPQIEAPEADYNAAPMTVHPVIRWERERRCIELAPCLWGLVPSWWTKPINERKFSGINVSVCEAEDRAVYRGAFRHWRCLVPVSGWYVWAGEAKSKTPFAVGRHDQDWLCLAGVWDTALIDGSVLESFSVLTTQPNDVLAGIATQMPVIIGKDDYARWLDPRSGAVDDLFEPWAAEELKAWPVRPEVGNVLNNYPDLVKEI
ncbi:MAG: SOS response-associated peptidase [Pseudomonadota bacterium]